MRPSKYFKLIIGVPTTHADQIRQALGKAGAGQQGNYFFCSSSHPSIGRFQPLPGAHPTIGKVGKLETVDEETIETVCHEDLLATVIAAVKAAHPYEEPAIDIVPRFEV